MNEIGSKLKTLRKGRGLTQLQLSEKVGLSRCSISNYECSRRSPHIHELRMLASFFGVSIDFFGIETKDESFELLSRAKSVLCNKEISIEERTRLYKEITRMYLEMED